MEGRGERKYSNVIEERLRWSVRRDGPMTDQPVALKDSGYELQLLLGAAEIVSFVEAYDNAAASDADKFGNLVNYFKDSIYLHGRNLLNALTNEYMTEIGAIPSSITSSVYGNIKDSFRALRNARQTSSQSGGRIQRTDGDTLSEHVHDLTAEVKRCWNEWIDLTSDQAVERASGICRSFSAQRCVAIEWPVELSGRSATGHAPPCVRESGTTPLRDSA